MVNSSLAASPPALIDPAHVVLHGLWLGLTQLASREPWLPAVIAAVVVLTISRATRIAIHSGPRDPVRRFARRDKAILLERAGHQCEHHAWLVGRCKSTDELEADHIHPHSRGGWTHLSNGQILCRTHNRTKSAAVPFDRSLRKIAERRAEYYPEGVSRTVERRPPKQPRGASRDPGLRV